MTGCSVPNWLRKQLGKDLSIMHAIFENGLWLTCDMGNCHSISMANSTCQFLWMKILPRKSTSTSQELPKIGTFRPRMWLMSWQLQDEMISWHQGWNHKMDWSVMAPHNGVEIWKGHQR